MTHIPYGRQDIDQADLDAVVEVLRSDFLTQGPVVPRFEQTVADYCGAKHAVAVEAVALQVLALDAGGGLSPGQRGADAARGVELEERLEMQAPVTGDDVRVMAGGALVPTFRWSRRMTAVPVRGWIVPPLRRPATPAAAATSGWPP